jgi:hypothetical protein
MTHATLDAPPRRVSTAHGDMLSPSPAGTLADSSQNSDLRACVGAKG